MDNVTLTEKLKWENEWKILAKGLINLLSLFYIAG